MLKIFTYYLSLSLFIISCKSNTQSSVDKVLDEQIIKKYLSIPIYEKPILYFEKSSDPGTNLCLLNQVYETLFHLNPKTQSLEPLLIATYSKDSSRTVYTLRLRENIFFQDDPSFPNGKGRKVTAADVVYCFSRLGKPWTRENYVINSTDSSKTISSDSVSNETPLISSITQNSTFELTIRLNKRDTTFLKKLCAPPFYVYPKEIQTTYYNSKKPILFGTGPFIYSTYKDNVYFLLKNPNYYLPNTPKIEGLRLVYCESDSVAYEMYKNGSIDLFYKSNKKDTSLEILPDIVNFDYENLRNWDFRSTFIQETLRLEPVN